MAQKTENLLFSKISEGRIKRQEVRTIIVRNNMVVEERYERVFFDDELAEYSDMKSTVPLVRTQT
jgi:hypothetical protein